MTFSPHDEAALSPLAPAVRPKQQDADQLAQTVLTSLEDAKAEDIVSVDLRGKTTLADLMIVATGRSNVHVRAIADRVVKACKAAGFAAPRIEGLPHCDWVLLDAHDAIVHIFKPDVRQFYNLEKMWGADRPGEKRQLKLV
nr:ribosome silencing factor [Methylocapsa sp. S129]